MPWTRIVSKDAVEASFARFQERTEGVAAADDWLADLAVGWGGDHIKIGSVTQSDRLAKYNRLLAIEAETQLPLAAPI